MVKVTLKDGSVREYEDNVTLLEVAKSLSQKLGKQALLAVVDGQNKDLSDKLNSAPVPGCKICHWPCHCQRILLRP